MIFRIRIQARSLGPALIYPHHISYPHLEHYYDPDPGCRPFANPQYYSFLLVK